MNRKRDILALLVIGFILATCQAPRTPESTPIPSPSPTSVPTQTITASPTAPAALLLPHPILSDVRLRQGIAYCTDKKALFSVLYPWIDDPEPFIMDSFLPPNHRAYLPDEMGTVRYPYDPEKGRQSLEEAGWRLNGTSPYRTNQAGERLSLRLVTTQAETRKKYIPVFIEQMKTCGVEIIPNYLPAEEFFGVDTAQPGELARRNFDLAVYAWVSEAELDLMGWFGCDQIPNAENGWRGNNYSGWCNPEADDAARQSQSAFERQLQIEAYRTLQREYAQDVPAIPLFSRVELHAADPSLENFAPNPSELFTWNAYRWKIDGKDTIVIGSTVEPATLFASDKDYVSQLVQVLVYGLNYTQLNYEFQAVFLKQIPSLENGLVTVMPVEVAEGDDVVDIKGELVTLAPGVQVRDAQGNIVAFSGEPLSMTTLVVEFQFVDNLTWSDGTPVTREDYALYYRAICDPATGAEEYLAPPDVCEKIAEVNFISDNSYVVTWKPGYREAKYQLPPISRLPAHQVLSNGQRLDETEPRLWLSLDEVRETPLGVGPYRVIRWVHGREIVLEANPYYALGAPTTENIAIRFVPIDAGIDPLALIEQDQVDVIGYDSLFNLKPDEAALFEAQAEGKIKLYPIPLNMCEQISLAITQP